MTGEQEMQVQANIGSMDVELEGNSEETSTEISANIGQKDELISQFIMGGDGIFDSTFDLSFN